MTEQEEIERLCNKSGFQPDDINSLINLYLKYIDKNASICTSCPSALRHFIKVFQANKDNMINKIKE